MGDLPGSRVRLGAGREFDMIRAFLGPDGDVPPEVRLGPGDDAAVLDGDWVISTDLSVEDVHFRRGWLTDREIGYRAASAALSDLAAMAARPVGVLVSMAAPRGAAVDVASAQAGVRAAAEAVGARVIGGDLSRSPGPLFIDVVVLGRSERPVSRAGARAGDELWVSGTLGAGAAALTVWEDGGVPPEPLRRRFVRPEPRVALALALAEAGIPVAMMDVSDGLAGDAGHLAAASGVGIVLEASALPVDPDGLALLGSDAALGAALHGGEDFELLFAARPGTVGEARAREGCEGVRLTRIGRVIEATSPDGTPRGPDAGPMVLLQDPSGALRALDRGGYDHWSDT
jgi:thiamine-monophosphate kinase